MYTNTQEWTLRAHEPGCKYISVEAGAQVEERKKNNTYDHHCPYENCDKSYLSESHLTSYIRHIHEYILQQCDHPDRTNQKEWQDKAAYDNHWVEKHDDSFTPTTCRVPGCTSRKGFNRRDVCHLHLRSVHRLSEEEKDVCCKKRAGWKNKYGPTTCQIPGKNWKTCAAYRNHLRRIHKLSEEERYVCPAFGRELQKIMRRGASKILFP